MKAKTFEKLLRKIVREEIDYSLRREIKNLKEDLRDELKPTITEYNEKKQEISNSVKQGFKEKIMGNTPPSKKQQTKELTFIEAIKIIEAKKIDKREKLDKDFF